MIKLLDISISLMCQQDRGRGGKREIFHELWSFFMIFFNRMNLAILKGHISAGTLIKKKFRVRTKKFEI